MPNTIGMLQVPGLVGSGENLGRLNMIDSPRMDTVIKRNSNIISILASAINANGGNLDVSLAKNIEITMDVTIPTLNLTGLNTLKAADAALTPVDANGFENLLYFIQSGAGNFGVTALGSSFTFSNEFNAISLSGTVGKRDVLGVSYSKIINKYQALQFIKGFN